MSFLNVIFCFDVSYLIGDDAGEIYPEAKYVIVK